jgi:cell division transport system permease protein
VAAVIRHALAEGWLLLRQRAATSLVLALALAVPIALAGVGLTVNLWLGPVAALSPEISKVAVLLHPRLDDEQRRQWIATEASAHPEWVLLEVSAGELADRLGRWFPYLDELLASGDASMPPLIEIETSDPETVGVLEGRPEVLAVGPRSSLPVLFGRVARGLAWGVGAVSAVLLASALLLAAVWVHLELFRHADELTIMRLVGATEGTVRGPFLVAVAVPAAVAGGLSVAASSAIVSGLGRLVATLGLPPLTMPPAVLLLQAAAAVILPVAAALITLARHTADQIDG